MKVEQRFEVPASSAETYELLIDLERVASCIPGGEVGPREQDGTHPASIAVKLGPMRMLYKGRVQIGEIDESARRAVLQADVREQRGQGTAKARMSMLVTETSSGSLVETVTEVALTGRAAQMGQGIVNEVADRLVADMASCIAGRLAHANGATRAEGAEGGRADRSDGGRAESPPPPPPPKAPPVNGISLLMRVLWGWLGRSVRALWQRLERSLRGKGGTR